MKRINEKKHELIILVPLSFILHLVLFDTIQFYQSKYYAEKSLSVQSSDQRNEYLFNFVYSDYKITEDVIRTAITHLKYSDDETTRLLSYVILKNNHEKCESLLPELYSLSKNDDYTTKILSLISKIENL